MRDITPKSEIDLILKSLGSAFGIVVLIAFFKVAFESFISVAGLILPIAIVIYILFKINGKINMSEQKSYEKEKISR